MKYRVGICQFKPELLDVRANLDKMEQLLYNKKADLIVLPELANSGYLFNSSDEVYSIAENAFRGITSQLFLNMAKQNNTSYVVGLAEKDEDKIFNSAILVNPDQSIFVYRKTHLFLEEKLWFTPGNTGFNIFPAKKDVKLGIMICFDWIFPESARTLSLKGAQIIAHPANLVLPWCQQAMITRSLENRVFTLTCNRTGKDINVDKQMSFTGMSQILDPEGKIMARLDQEEEKVIIAEIETDNALDKNITPANDLFKDRRSEFYQK
ncbi:MAG: hypothetical protein APR54_05140 [Candidatus Cloacimonas sp. SDB]|nr:MAG: hypothetical protein APR54_05140 [Candidatus Cloacimonas sp. SDB]